MTRPSLKTLFDQALEISDRQARLEYLDEACGDDTALRSQALALLEAYAQADSFLDRPPAELADAMAELPATEGCESIGESPGTEIGPYKLLQELGEGGFGVVFVAKQTAPVRRKVALKIIKPGMDSKAVIARFEAERQALALMDHTHIAKVLDAGTTQSGRPYFVMELINGVPITRYCDELNLSIRERLRLYIPVCHAIQHAHQKGIIHRDIKPSNVLVCMQDGVPVAKVIDFGVAKALHQRLTDHSIFTEIGQVIGTVEYMSPEQAELSALDIDTRADVYALGVLLYELVAGSTPLDRRRLKDAAILELLRIIRDEEPPKPSTRLSDSKDSIEYLASRRRTESRRLTREVRGELDWIVMKCLEKDRTRRYDSSLSLARDIGRFLEDQPVEAGPPSPIYRARKFLVRRRLPLAASAIVALVMVGSLAWVGSAELERRRTRDRNSDRLSDAVEDASLALGQAINSPIGRDTEWVAARASQQQVEDLLIAGDVHPRPRQNADRFLAMFQESYRQRELAEQLEEVVIMGATHEDLESWKRMEAQLRALFRDRGIDLDQLPPPEVARRIREHRAAAQLSDALELWIGTRGQMAMLGGPRLTSNDMQPWAEAMYDADPDATRTGIRRLIYSGRMPKPEDVEAVIDGVSLKSLTPRTLSWLANVFMMSGDVDRADEVFALALLYYPSDFMLNFDYAYAMTMQARWPEAIRMHMRCLAIRPDVAGVWRSLGVALRHNGELKQACAALERSVQLQSDHAPTWLDLAEAQLEHEDFASAAESARRALTIGDRDAEALGCLGRALLGAGQLEEALETLQRCQSLVEENPSLRLPVEQWLQDCRDRMQNDAQSTSAVEISCPIALP